MLPNITIPVVTTVTYYTGASPLDMEQSVTRLIERSVSSINDVSYVKSSTREGISAVQVIFFNWMPTTECWACRLWYNVSTECWASFPPVSRNLCFAIRHNEPSGMRCCCEGDMDERDLYDLAFNIIEPQIDISTVSLQQLFQAENSGNFMSRSTGKNSGNNIPVQTVLNRCSQFEPHHSIGWP